MQDRERAANRREKPMKKSMALGIVLAMMGMTIGGTGCLGRSAMGKSLAEWNLQVVQNKWARWGVFVLLGPAYGFVGGVDLMVLNSIEFHTGTNPWSGESRLAQAGETRVQQGGGGEMVVSTLRADGSIDVVITDSEGRETKLNVLADDGQVVARDGDGQVVARAPDPRL
jgi:hypothetical protein